ncbi:MAG: hypothetical protein ACR2F2_00820 [Pyrinomonadaceae bacterium]
MKFVTLFLLLIFCFASFTVSAQNENARTTYAVENISTEISKISKSLDDLNKKLGTFSETFNSNQGLRLTEKQQRLLFAFEMLNRAETRLSTLQILKIQLADREATTKRKIAQIDDNMRSENIDRTLSGTLDAEAVRAARRRTLQNERNDLSKLLNEIQSSIRDTDYEIVQTQLFLRRIRGQIFPGIEKELSDL